MREVHSPHSLWRVTVSRRQDVDFIIIWVKQLDSFMSPFLLAQWWMIQKKLWMNWIFLVLIGVHLRVSSTWRRTVGRVQWVAPAQFHVRRPVRGSGGKFFSCTKFEKDSRQVCTALLKIITILQRHRFTGFCTGGCQSCFQTESYRKRWQGWHKVLLAARRHTWGIFLKSCFFHKFGYVGYCRPEGEKKKDGDDKNDGGRSPSQKEDRVEGHGTEVETGVKGGVPGGKKWVLSIKNFVFCM